MIAAGYSSASSYQDGCQVIDLSSTNSCTSLTAYPLKIDGLTGGLLDGRPLLCGGWGKASDESSYTVQSACYQYDKSSQAWNLFANMNTERDFSASALINGGLWVVGGETYEDYLESTEFIYSNGSAINGPNLPATRSEHCMVTLNNGMVMILGGYQSSNRKSVIIFNPEDNTFTTGPTLLYGRYSHGCTLFTSPLHGNRNVVLVIGGGQNTAEILDYTDDNAAWEESKHIYP